MAERLSWERDTLQTEAVCLSQELQGLRSSAARLSSERDALQGVVEKMQCELRELRRLLCRKGSECYYTAIGKALRYAYTLCHGQKIPHRQ